MRLLRSNEPRLATFSKAHGGRDDMEEAGSQELVSLEASLRPLKDEFNSQKGKVKFLALLSPT
jgi:hypothetical protein